MSQSQSSDSHHGAAEHAHGTHHDEKSGKHEEKTGQNDETLMQTLKHIVHHSIDRQQRGSGFNVMGTAQEYDDLIKYRKEQELKGKKADNV